MSLDIEQTNSPSSEISELMAERFKVGLRAAAADIHACAVAKGWWQDGKDRNFGEMLALIHSEVSEALEEYRTGDDGSCISYDDNGKPVGLLVEMADTLIRILDVCYSLPGDLAEATTVKMAYNWSRSVRHGGKKC